MIQFNLLPDVKIEYLKSRYRQRMAVTISVIVSSVFIALLVVSAVVVKVVQPHQMKNNSKDIVNQTKEINKIENLDKILTVQNQLKSLPGLHDKKSITSRLFEYLKQVTPAQATISDATLDIDAGTLSIQGNADSLNTVNKFADTLKFTKFKSGGADNKEGNAFSNVVLSSFSVATAGGSGAQAGKAISYKLDFSFDPVIFQNVKDGNGKSTTVKLTVPTKVTTRSATEQPAVLFDSQSQPAPKTEGTN